MESLDMLANNIANAETGGYKLDREFYSLYVSADAAPAGTEAVSTQPVIEKNYTDFSQGVMRVTANPLDLAIQGKGFFAVNSPAGVAYTRTGSLQMSSDGTLITPEGYALRDIKGQPMQLNAGLPVTVAADGTISQGGQAVGQLALADFSPGALVKQGNTLFRTADPNVQPQVATGSVQQGKIETSNVGTSDSAVRLVSVMRQFEMLQKAINIGADMNKKTIEEVARVTS